MPKMDFRYEAVFATGVKIRLCEISNVPNREAADDAAQSIAAAFALEYPGKPFKIIEYMTVYREVYTETWLTDTNDPAPAIRVPERWRRTTLLRQVAGDYMHDRPALTHNVAVQGLIEAIIDAVNASEVGDRAED